LICRRWGNVCCFNISREIKKAFMYNIILVFFSLLVISTSTYAQELPQFNVRAVRLRATDSRDENRMRQALQIFEKVMNDTAFQRKLLDTTFVFDLPDDPMRTLSPKQICDTLFSGKEWYDTDTDHTADIFWECTKRRIRPPFTSTIGYGNPNDSTINTYIFFVRNRKMQDIVGNLAHEWSHKIGFDHRPDNHPERERTVPYLFGNLVEKFAKKIYSW